MEKKRIALLSVFDKTGIIEFASSLIELGFVIISSGGTAKMLKDAGLEVCDTADFTGLKAILGHRVATLHPKIYAGLLALDTDEHHAELLANDYEWIDLVCCDFYPLKNETENPNATTDSVIEKTDIGGPTMIRAGAKGKRITICDAADRPMVIKWLKDGELDKENFINKLSAKAEMIVAEYCATSGTYHDKKYRANFGEVKMQLRYGENAPQSPAYLIQTNTDDPLAIHKFEIHAGNPSMINMTDVDRALNTMTHIAAAMDINFGKVPFIAIGVKHGNACGAATDHQIPEIAVLGMLEGNLKSIFGGTVMVNFEIDQLIAKDLVEHRTDGKRRPLDVVIGSDITEEAIKILKRQNDRCLIMTNLALDSISKETLDHGILHRYVRGGLIEQPSSTFILDLKHEELVYHPTPNYSSGVKFYRDKDTILAWAICSTSNSNTITLVDDGMLIGNGVGQQDRVEAAELAIKRAREAGHSIEGAVAVSDSFFPYPDAPKILLDAGVVRILTTSGSINDKLTVELFDKNEKCELLMIPDKIARGFFGH